MLAFLLSRLSTELPFGWEWLPQPSYLVGGAVRDRLLDRNSEYLDLDFVLPEKAVETARAIAKHYKAGFVLLDAQRQIARVVFKNITEATVDFALQEGATLEADLRRRDFTINAIAYNPHTQELIDPLQGYTDLQQRVLRMVSPVNLQDDPLRLLRAYRQAAQLGFEIEPNTQATIRQLAPLIKRVAAERVRVELGYLFNSASGSPWLQAAWEDGLLTPWFPSATRSHLTRLLKVDSTATTISSAFPKLVEELSQSVRDTLKTSWWGIAKLACLISPNPEIAEVELDKLTYSRAEIKAVTTALQLLPQLQAKTPVQMTLADQYFFFRTAGVVFPVVIVLAVVQEMSLDALSPLIHRYLNPQDPVAHPTAILSGNDLMKALKLPPSPLIGELLLQIQLAKIEGKISTIEDAIAFASKRLDIS
jgi:tRNA nucleotidyltransferase (CCA-adding enzyme)